PEQEGIVVFPNPAKSTIGISGLAAFGDSCIIELMDATGKQVVTMKIINAANNLSLSVQEVSSGYYTLMISSNTHKRHIEKVLILD
ncbi:MAG: T9SS type A sorting domain-containing protein, partial [Crocinitomicaceae bacterium]|nr:T9SS type A sorting domain-containing protein [Crocinitomicaceae bacterium]